MEKNIEEMRRLLYLKEDINEMNASIKSLEEKVTDLKYEKNMMMAGSKLRDIKQEEIDENQKELEELINLRDETDKKFREDSESLKTQMKDSIQNEMDSYQRRDEIEKQRPEIELYRQGITNLEAEVARLEAERQEISEKIKNDALNGDLDLNVDNNDLSRMNAVAALIRSDKARIADMKSKVEAFDNLKVLEDNIEEYSNLEYELANIDQNFNLEEMIAEADKNSEPELAPTLEESEPMGNSEELTMEELFRSGTLTEEEIKELLGTTSEIEQEQKPFSESEPPENSGTLTEEEIEELLKTTSETEQKQESKPTPTSEVEPKPMGNSEEMSLEEMLVSEGILTEEEIKEILGTTSETEQELSSKPEPMKAKNEYDWGDLTEDQIDELWAEGIVPGSQEYKQAYGNFAKVPPYQPEVHDTEPESEKEPPLPEQDDINKIIEEIFEEQLLREYFSEEEIDSLENDIMRLLLDKAFEKSYEIRFVSSLIPQLNEEERKERYQNFMEEREKETERFNKALENYMEKLQNKVEELGDKADVTVIFEQIERAKFQIESNNEYLDFFKLAIEKDVLFNSDAFNDLANACERGEISLETEQESEETEQESEQKPEETEQTPPQGVDLTEEETKALEEIFDSQSKAHENRLAKMLGTAGSWFASKGEGIRDKIVKRKEKVVESDEKEDSNLPTLVKEGNLFTRIGKAIGDKVAQWREEVTAEEENPYYYDEETYNETKKKREERAEKREIKKAEKEKAKREKKNLEKEIKRGIAEDVNEILDRDSEGDTKKESEEQVAEPLGRAPKDDTQKESEEQDRPNLVGYDTRDIGFIKKWTQGELRRPVRVDLEDGRKAWLGPNGKIDYEAENNPWPLKENENVNAVNQKEEESTENIEDEELEDLKETEKRIKDLISEMEQLNGEIVEDTMTDKAETSKPWDVSDDVKKATEEVGRKAGEKKEVLKGDVVNVKVTRDGMKINTIIKEKDIDTRE